MLLCSGPLTNTIQSWVKPSTVGFFLTWARCPNSSFTWTAHCRGRCGERPLSASGQGPGRVAVGNRTHRRQRGNTRTKQCRKPGKKKKNRERKAPTQLRNKNSGPRRGCRRAFTARAATRRGAAGSPRCRPAGAGGRGPLSWTHRPARLQPVPPVQWQEHDWGDTRCLPPGGWMCACYAPLPRAADNQREAGKAAHKEKFHVTPASSWQQAPGGAGQHKTEAAPRYSPSWPCLGRRLH